MYFLYNYEEKIGWWGEKLNRFKKSLVSKPLQILDDLKVRNLPMIPLAFWAIRDGIMFSWYFSDADYFTVQTPVSRE